MCSWQVYYVSDVLSFSVHPQWHKGSSIKHIITISHILFYLLLWAISQHLGKLEKEFKLFFLFFFFSILYVSGFVLKFRMKPETEWSCLRLIIPRGNSQDRVLRPSDGSRGPFREFFTCSLTLEGCRAWHLTRYKVTKTTDESLWPNHICVIFLF